VLFDWCASELRRGSHVLAVFEQRGGHDRAEGAVGEENNWSGSSRAINKEMKKIELVLSSQLADLDLASERVLGEVLKHRGDEAAS
jgi:hypothetical protein